MILSYNTVLKKHSFDFLLIYYECCFCYCKKRTVFSII
jgi:hypothetical protein